MKFTTIFVAVAVCVALVSSSPVAQNEGLRSQVLERLVMVEGDNADALRSKRTIGVLRTLFPQITEIVDQKVNAIVMEVVRAVGPTILRRVLGGGADGTPRSGPNDAGTTVELALPDDVDDDDDTTSTSDDEAIPPVVLPKFPADDDGDNDVAAPSTTTDVATQSTTTEAAVTTTQGGATAGGRKRRVRRIRSVTNAKTAVAEDRAIEDTAESQNNEVRVQFADEQSSPAANEAVESELAPLDDIEVSDDENRNKRFLNFLAPASAGGAGGAGSGGGFGNFLFDIIRQAADGAARAAGTVYRVVAGTQSLGLGLSATRDVGPAPPINPAPSAPAAAPAPSAPAAMPAPAAAPAPGAGVQPPLVTGSGSQQDTDPAAGAPSPGGRNDGTTEAVPGPVTRLFVIANRGVSNLIQDLILRLAATSERIVNFKARLITSII